MASQRSRRRSSLPASASPSPASSSRSRATRFRSNVGSHAADASKSPREKQPQDQNVSHVLKLPVDLLCKCFSKLECVYHIVACASVCRNWRNALEADMVWKEFYRKWHGPTQELPPASTTWRQAFVKDLEQGRERLLRNAFGWAVEAGLIKNPITDSKLAAGASFQMLAEHLGLTFLVRINGGSQCRISAKGTSFFPASVVLHYPFKSVKSKTRLAYLSSIEVVVLSDRLSQMSSVVYCSGSRSRGLHPWDAVTGLPVVSFSPLRLLQRNVSSGVNLIVGTLFESPDRMAFGHEEVLFIKVGLHLHVVLTEMMKLKQSLPAYPIGTYGLTLSVQLHTFQKLLWSQTFNDVNISVEAPLLHSFQVVSGKPSLPWRSEAFSGELEQTLVATVTLWDSRAEVLWSCVKIFQLIPISAPSFEVIFCSLSVLCLRFLHQYSLSMSEGARFSGDIDDPGRAISFRWTCWVPFDEERHDAFVLTDFRIFRKSTEE